MALEYKSWLLSLKPIEKGKTFWPPNALVISSSVFMFVLVCFHVVKNLQQENRQLEVAMQDILQAIRDTHTSAETTEVVLKIPSLEQLVTVRAYSTHRLNIVFLFCLSLLIFNKTLNLTYLFWNTLWAMTSVSPGHRQWNWRVPRAHMMWHSTWKFRLLRCLVEMRN